MRVRALVGALLLASAASSQETDDARALLEQHLGKAISITASASARTIEYCPDNTCEVFRAPSSTSVAVLSDFAFLFLYHRSDYTDLAASSFRKGTHEAAPRIVEPYRRECQEPEVTPHCVLLGMAKTHRIAVSFARYDEGERNETPLDL